jgi:hypothetical protein
MDLAIHGFGGPGAAKGKCACIARIMEDPQDIVMLQIAPGEFALVRSTPYAPWKRHLGLVEGTHSRRGRPRPPKRAKEEPEGILDLPVGIEDNAVILGIAEPNRQMEFQGCPAGFIEDATL